jgi:hypothetical protein
MTFNDTAAHVVMQWTFDGAATVLTGCEAGARAWPLIESSDWGKRQPEAVTPRPMGSELGTPEGPEWGLGTKGFGG